MAQSRLLMTSRPLPRLTPDPVLPRSHCSSAYWVWSATGAGGRRRSPPAIVSPSRAIATSQIAIPESSLEPASGGDEAVDLAIAEQPSSVLLCHLVGVGAARPDLWPFGAVLHHGPVRAHLGALAIWSTGQHDGDIGHQMHRARPVVAGLGTDVARQARDPHATGRLAKGGVPGAVLGKQRRHVVIAAAIEPKAIFGHGLADGVLFLDRGRHLRVLPKSLMPHCSRCPAKTARLSAASMVSLLGELCHGRIRREPGGALCERRAGADALRCRCRGRRSGPARHALAAGQRALRLAARVAAVSLCGVE